jgi:hypothetical protein
MNSGKYNDIKKTEKEILNKKELKSKIYFNFIRTKEFINDKTKWKKKSN